MDTDIYAVLPRGTRSSTANQRLSRLSATDRRACSRQEPAKPLRYDAEAKYPACSATVAVRRISARYSKPHPATRPIASRQRSQTSNVAVRMAIEYFAPIHVPRERPIRTVNIHMPGYLSAEQSW